MPRRRSFYYTIRGPRGRLLEVYMTPREAIKFFCLECVGFEPGSGKEDAIKYCPDTYCPLYPFRGKPNGYKRKYGFYSRKRPLKSSDDK